MLAYLIGKVKYVCNKKMIFENQYKGLWINIHQNSDFVADDKKFIKIYCYNYQSSNLKNLLINEIYGFRYLIECELFVDLISINGVGPKTALNIIAHGAKEVVWMINNKATESLSEISGVNRKLALVIISSLEDKYLKKTNIGTDKNQQSYDINDVWSALKNLGYNEADIKYGINVAMNDMDNNNEELKEVSDFIAYAIKAIAKQHNDTTTSSTEL